MADKSYIGKGKVHKDGIFIGNVSELNFSIEEDKKELQDFTSAGGGLYNSLARIDSVTMSMIMHDYNKENLARALFGTASTVAAGAVVGESQTAPADVSADILVPTDNIIDIDTPVTVTGFVQDTDYTASAAGITILAAGSITASAALTIGYTKLAADVVQGLTTTAQECVLVFDGLNEAQSGAKVVITVLRAKFGAAQDMSIIGDDFGALSLEGDALKDLTVVTAGLSQYLHIKQAA